MRLTPTRQDGLLETALSKLASRKVLAELEVPDIWDQAQPMIEDAVKQASAISPILEEDFVAMLDRLAASGLDLDGKTIKLAYAGEEQVNKMQQWWANWQAQRAKQQQEKLPALQEKQKQLQEKQKQLQDKREAPKRQKALQEQQAKQQAQSQPQALQQMDAARAAVQQASDSLKQALFNLQSVGNGGAANYAQALMSLRPQDLSNMARYPITQHPDVQFQKLYQALGMNVPMVPAAQTTPQTNSAAPATAPVQAPAPAQTA